MSNVEILRRVEPRRAWSAAEKAALLAEVDAEGGKVRLVARRHRILESLLYNWRAAAKAEAAAPQTPAAPSVTVAEMLQTLGKRSGAAISGRRIVIAQDTTEINFSGRQARRRGISPAGNGVILHPPTDRHRQRDRGSSWRSRRPYLDPRRKNRVRSTP